jgi:hypothetical protein
MHFMLYAMYMMTTRKLHRLQGNDKIKHVYAYNLLAVSALTG